MFDKLEQRLLIKGTIETVTPLHIGSGQSDLEKFDKADMAIVKDNNGQPYIPGSSLKGKTRSEAERILKKEVGFNVCSPPDVRKMCGSTKSSPAEFCLPCKIFGTAAAGRGVSIASKVRFRDAYPTQNVVLLQRSGTAIDRQTGTVSRGALYSIEAVPAGVVFNFEIVAENLGDDELRVLCAALKSVEHSALGGASSRGFEKIKFVFESVVERTAAYYLGKENEKAFSGEALKKWFLEKGCV